MSSKRPSSGPRSGEGDPARTLELLWRDAAAPVRRGPRQGLSIDAVVAAATDLADVEGLEAVTMRRLAETLGVSTMTLYTYVPGKAELLDIMLDAAYAGMPRSETSGRPWRDRLEAVAHENRAMFETHPWAAAVFTSRPPLGPGLMEKYEHELCALDGLRLSDVEMDAALTFLLAFVRGWAHAAADARASQRESAMDDQQWWEANAELLARVFDPSRHPLAARVGSAAGAAHGAAYSPEHAYEFGLQRTLDGVAVLIEGAAADSTP